MALALRRPHTHQDWLDWRRLGIGGSDAAAVFGLSPFQTPLGLYLDKIGRLPALEQSAEMEWGTRLEAAVIEKFEDETGMWVTERQQWRVHRDPELAFMRCTLDGLCLPGGEEPAAGIFEGKTSNAFRHEWGPVPAGEFGGVDGVPEHVQIQVQHELAVTGYDRAWVAVLIGGQDFRMYQVERDEAVIFVLVEREREFWQRVEARVPPAADASETTAAALRASYPHIGEASVELPGEALDLVMQRRAARANEAIAGGQAQAAENALMALLGDAEVGTYEGEVLVTWKRYERTSVDATAVRSWLGKHPALARRWLRTSAFRRLGFPKEDDSNGGQG